MEEAETNTNLKPRLYSQKLHKYIYDYTRKDVSNSNYNAVRSQDSRAEHAKQKELKIVKAMASD